MEVSDACKDILTGKTLWFNAAPNARDEADAHINDAARQIAQADMAKRSIMLGKLPLPVRLIVETRIRDIETPDDIPHKRPGFVLFATDDSPEGVKDAQAWAKSKALSGKAKIIKDAGCVCVVVV